VSEAGLQRPQLDVTAAFNLTSWCDQSRSGRDSTLIFATSLLNTDQRTDEMHLVVVATSFVRVVAGAIFFRHW